MAVYVISIKWATQPDKAQAAKIEAALAALGDWARLDGGIWFVQTDSNSEAIYAALSQILLKTDFEIITRVDSLDYKGWLPQWLVNWIAARIN